MTTKEWIVEGIVLVLETIAVLACALGITALLVLIHFGMGN